METKVCAACGIEKPLDDFWATAQNKDGHYSYCKECARKKHADSYARKKERKKERKKDGDR